MQFDTLIAQIQTDINDTSARTETRIKSWINDGVQAICTRRSWNFLTINKSDETSLVDTDMPLLFSALKKDTVIVPAKHITHVFDVTDGTREEVNRINYEDLNMSQYDYEVDSTPLYWYMDNTNALAKQIQFFPKLTTTTRKFIFSYTILVPTYTAAEVIAIPDQYIHVLNNYVDWRVNKFSSDDRAQDSFSAYMTGLNDMIKDDSSVLHSGTGRLVDRFSNGVDIP